MPKIEAEVKEEIPEVLRPYVFHGVDLGYRPRDKEAVGDCPFCGREKFSVNTSTGQWRCLVCNEGDENGKSIKGGNATIFIQKLLAQSDKSTTEYNEFCEQRGLLYPETLVDWNVCKSISTGEWLVPGWSWSESDKSARMTQLYRYVKTPKRYNLFPTPTLGGKLFGLNLFDPKKETVYICESVWDAMAVYEILKIAKYDDRGKLVQTSNVDKSLYGTSNIVATPGCTTFFESWLPLFANKKVVILAQNDHPKPHPKTGEMLPPASYNGALRIIRMLSEADVKPLSVSLLLWGDDGYDESLPSGYDARDALKASGDSVGERIRSFEQLIGRFTLKTEASSPSVSKSHGDSSKASLDELEALPCDSYRDLTLSWRKAMKWTDGLDYALSVMLAAVASTKLLGDQLWFMVISPPSTGKSTLCEALSANKKYVIAKSTIRGFHSGYKSDREGEEDNSLIPHIMGKTLIVKDADSLLTAPNKEQILGEARDLYDCTSRSHYKNKMGKDYVGIRMTLLLCGTAALREMDASELGARFLCCTIMNKIDEELEHEVGWRVVNRADMMLAFESDGKMDSHQSPEMTQVMRLSSGYVSYLRENVVELMSQIEVSDKAKEYCVHLGKFVSYMRARPSKKQDESVEREFSARLISQLYRAAKCLAVVLNRDSMDDLEVMKRVKRIAIDTSQGQTYEFTKLLFEAGVKGHEAKWLSHHTSRGMDKINHMMRFLKQIGVVENFQVTVKNLRGTKLKWRLTRTVYELFAEVHHNE